MKQMYDVVYPLGGGSKWQDNELRYRLRSIDRFFPARNVYVIGEAPEWFTGIAIRFVDGNNRVKNVFEKQRIACEHPDVSSDFLYMNDDIYLLQAIGIKHYYYGTVAERFGEVRPASSYYGLASTDPDWFNFSTHSPFMINKLDWLRIFEGVEPKIPFFIGDQYGNRSKLWEREELPGDSKYRERDRAGLERFIQGKKFFSTPTYMNWAEVAPLFEELYPEKSRWER